MNSIAVVSVLFSFAAIFTVIIWQRRKRRKLLLSLHRMLDEAIRGEFQESSYDESLLSAVEMRMVRYLSASCVAAKNLTEEKEKIKELIADISHQTKTPISNILLYAQLLEEQPLPPESIPCVRALNAQAEKLNFLVGSLVKVSRLEAGVFVLSPKLQPIQSLLDSTIEQSVQKAMEKGVTIESAQTKDLSACFDWKWTAEALHNLVDNAVKYTPSGGRVQLTAVAYELFTRIDVADTGIGIPEDEQEKIFGRFYRGNGVRETEGVGIGLYLARQILTEEGGYIKVSSRNGQGTVFSMFLPAKASEKEKISKL